MNIWLCGIPGSKWSGVDIQLRHCCNCDKSDETPDRVFFHKLNNPRHSFNGHRGSYWGPGMGCGESWDDMSMLSPGDIQSEIDSVFNGEGHKTIKAHNLARNQNLEYVWDNFKGDYMVLFYRDPDRSLEWWDRIMDFDSDRSYPDYSKMYENIDTMHDYLRTETTRILEFAFNKELSFKIYDPVYSFQDIPGWDYELAKDQTKGHDDVYVCVARID